MEQLELTRDDHYTLCIEGYIGDQDFTEVESVYEGSTRHTEQHTKVLRRESDGKYFRVYYETSVKDEMGWKECNQPPFSAREVVPEQKIITVYK